MIKETKCWKWVTGAFLAGYSTIMLGLNLNASWIHPELGGKIYLEPVSYMCADIPDVQRKRERMADKDGNGFLSKDEFIEYLGGDGPVRLTLYDVRILRDRAYLDAVKYRISNGLPLDEEDRLILAKAIERKNSRNRFKVKTTTSDLVRISDLDSDGTFEESERFEIKYGREPVPSDKVYLPYVEKGR